MSVCDKEKQRFIRLTPERHGHVGLRSGLVEARCLPWSWKKYDVTETLNIRSETKLMQHR